MSAQFPPLLHFQKSTLATILYGLDDIKKDRPSRSVKITLIPLSGPEPMPHEVDQAIKILFPSFQLLVSSLRESVVLV